MEAIYNFQRWGLPFFEQKEIPRDYAANALIPKMGKKLFSGKKSWNDNDLIDNYWEFDHMALVVFFTILGIIM